MQTNRTTLSEYIWSAQSISPAIRSVVLAFVGTMLLTVSAKVQVPFWPVPMTMQTFAVLVIAMAYGRRLGVATVALYLAEGAVGLPVFAGGGGLAYMTGPTGGYLAGFLVAALLVGLLADRQWDRSFWPSLAAMTAGTAIIFCFGVTWLATLIGLESAISGGLTPFLLGAAFKIALAAAILPIAWRIVRAPTA